MKKLIISAAIVVTAIALAPAANADGKDSYLTYLREHGVDDSGFEWEGQTLAEGKLVCTDLNKGVPEATAYTNQQALGRSNALSSVIVRGAHQYLCPNAPVAFDDSYLGGTR